MMTGTIQLMGHLNRLLDLLWQLLTLGRPAPINSTEKNTPLKSITGTGIVRCSSPHAQIFYTQPPNGFRSTTTSIRTFFFERNSHPTFAAIVSVQSGTKLADNLYV
jgi:hypothetical protein